MVDQDRRTVVRVATAAAGLTVLTGCNQSQHDDPGDTNTGGDSTTPTATPEPMRLEIVQNGEIDVKWSSGLFNIDEVRNEHTAVLNTELPDGVDPEDATIKIDGGFDKERTVEEVRNGQNILEAPQLFEGTNTVTVQHQDRESEPVTVEKQVPDQYRADIKHVQDGETVNQRDSSPYRFDDIHFRQERIDSRRQEWNEEDAYEGFVSDIENDADYKPNKYAHYSYPNEETVEPNGKFDLERFEAVNPDEFDTNEEAFLTLMDWIVPAAKERLFRKEDSSAPSRFADRTSASIEQAIDEVHPDANVRGWGVYQPGHGTMMFYDEEWDTGWWHVDTTSAFIVKPENAQKHREDIWSPFTEFDPDNPDQGGFHPGPSQTSEVGYHRKSQVSRNAILDMVVNGAPDNGEEFSWNSTFITDEWLEDAYQHIHEDGGIEPILEPIEEIVDYQTETGNITGIYGTLDDTRVAAGENLGNMYEQVMREPEVMTTEKIEGMLEEGAAA